MLYKRLIKISFHDSPGHVWPEKLIEAGGAMQKMSLNSRWSDKYLENNPSWEISTICSSCYTIHDWPGSQGVSTRWYCGHCSRVESLEAVFSCILQHQVRRNEIGQYLPATGVKCEIVIDFENVTANGDICGEEHWRWLRRNGGGWKLWRGKWAW